MLRLALLSAALLAACAAPDSDPAPPLAVPSEPAATPVPDEHLDDRAAAAGLDAAQAARLTALGVPTVVPVLPEGWTLTDFTAEADTYGGIAYPRYSASYRHADGACFALAGESEGLGDVFYEEPPHSREVAAPGIASYGPVLLGWFEAGEGEAEAPELLSEWFGADGIAVGLRSLEADGCRRLDPDAAAALVGGLRYLDPADDALALGPMAWVDLGAPPIGELANGPTPEATAAQAFAMTETEGRAATATETLRRREGHAVVLVTTTSVPDDSIQDERIRVVLQPGDEGWLVTQAGRQVRCREGRGHADWGAAACL